MAKRKITPLPRLTQSSLFTDLQLMEMLHTKVIECLLLKQLIPGDQFTFKDTKVGIPITEIQFASALDTYLFHGSMYHLGQSRPFIVSVTTGEIYMPYIEIWERQVLVVRDRLLQTNQYDKRNKSTTA